MCSHCSQLGRQGYKTLPIQRAVSGTVVSCLSGHRTEAGTRCSCSQPVGSAGPLRHLRTGGRGNGNARQSATAHPLLRGFAWCCVALRFSCVKNATKRDETRRNATKRDETVVGAAQAGTCSKRHETRQISNQPRSTAPKEHSASVHSHSVPHTDDASPTVTPS